MGDTRSADSPLDTAAETVGEQTPESFKLLSNETRLAILLALWGAYHPFKDNRVSFSELRERVGIRDSGNFNYHLCKLEDQFVERTHDEYHLTQAGLNIVQTVIAGTATHAPSFEAEEVEESCFRCGASVEVTYEEETTKVGYLSHISAAQSDES